MSAAVSASERCRYRLPLTPADAHLEPDGADEQGRECWRACCACGWSCAGYLTRPAAYGAIRRHRRWSADLTELAPETLEELSP